ncbi:hypothetical protein AMECASPLE_022003, partial [Ameca splendens]
GAPLHHCPRTSSWGGALEPTSARKAGRGLRATSGEETVVVLVWEEKEKELHKNPTETGGTNGQPGAQAWMTFSHSVEKGTQWLSVCGWTTQRMTSTWGSRGSWCFSSSLWAGDGLHPGQVASPSQ